MRCLEVGARTIAQTIVEKTATTAGRRISFCSYSSGFVLCETLFVSNGFHESSLETCASHSTLLMNTWQRGAHRNNQLACWKVGYAAPQLVEASRYKLEGRAFDSRRGL
jgi:hypothetical protein